MNRISRTLFVAICCFFTSCSGTDKFPQEKSSSTSFVSELTAFLTVHQTKMTNNKTYASTVNALSKIKSKVQDPQTLLNFFDTYIKSDQKLYSALKKTFNALSVEMKKQNNSKANPGLKAGALGNGNACHSSPVFKNMGFSGNNNKTFRGYNTERSS